ncbi:MAG: hypothetical protein GY862_00350 [Gammaproteobacteria bacterium]|nr:hypothetical protein [Gammaproteobacteria bacterium]
MKRFMFVSIIAISLAGLKPVFAQSQSDCQALAPDPGKAKACIQAGYAESAAREISYALDIYEENNGVAAPLEAFERAMEGLLGNGKDPLIAGVNYEPGFYFDVVMRSASPVAESLQGETFRHSLEIMKGMPAPADDSALPEAYAAIFAGPAPLIETYFDVVVRYCSKSDPDNAQDCLSVVTSYCIKPTGYKFPMPGSLSDEEWCPAWHSFVMPSAIAERLPQAAADADATENVFQASELLPDPIAARVRIQMDNALRTGLEIANALDVYRERYTAMAPQEAFAWFVGEMLGNGGDPMIACVDYASEGRFAIELRSIPPIEDMLQGRVLAYRFEEEKWLLAEQEQQPPACQADLSEVAGDASAIQEASAIQIDRMPDPLMDTYLDVVIRHCSRPDPSVAHGCLEVTAGYCKNPRDYQFQVEGSFLPDRDWCPAWNEFIMPGNAAR